MDSLTNSQIGIGLEVQTRMAEILQLAFGVTNMMHELVLLVKLIARQLVPLGSFMPSGKSYETFYMYSDVDVPPGRLSV